LGRAAISSFVMANVDEILRGHVLLEVEFAYRLYLNGHIPTLATSGVLVTIPLQISRRESARASCEKSMATSWVQQENPFEYRSAQ